MSRASTTLPKNFDFFWRWTLRYHSIAAAIAIARKSDAPGALACGFGEASEPLSAVVRWPIVM
jgi:hypothetical protein